MNALFVRLNGGVNPKEHNQDYFRVNVEEQIIGAYAECQKDGNSVDEIEACEKTKPVFVATLEGVYEGHEFVDASESQCSVDEPMFAEST